MRARTTGETCSAFTGKSLRGTAASEQRPDAADTSHPSFAVHEHRTTEGTWEGK